MLHKMRLSPWAHVETQRTNVDTEFQVDILFLSVDSGGSDEAKQEQKPTQVRGAKAADPSPPKAGKSDSSSEEQTTPTETTVSLTTVCV